MKVLVEPPEGIYDKEWVEKVVYRKTWRYIEVPKQVKVIWEFFEPESVLDIGASNGLFLEEMANRGSTIFGIEGTKYFVPYLNKSLGVAHYLIKDIRMPFDLKRGFDLVCSIEVLEHIDHEYTGIAIDNIIRHGKRFFITASSQSGGRYHVNAHEPDYWMGQFTKRGVSYDGDATERIREEFRCANIKSPWFTKNSMIFYKE